MAHVIEDGTGDGYKLKIDSKNRAATTAVSSTELETAVKVGDGYNINTGAISLTSANESALLYVKNTGTRDIHNSSIIVGLGTSTGGSGEGTITIVRNPTAGTIVSGASAVAMNSNRNFGSNLTLSVDAYKGAEGNTITDGTDHIIAFGWTGTRVVIPVNEIIPPGQSLGIQYTPPSGNTSMNVYAAIVTHLEEDE